MKRTSKPSILIVACDPHFSSIIGRRFGAKGWKVELADTLPEAHRKGAKLKPSVFLLHRSCVSDITLEVKKLHKLPTLLKTKIVILAETGDAGEVQELRKAGSAGYLIRGQFTPSEMVELMRKLIES